MLVTDHLTYKVTVNNAGEGEATGVTLTDTLDPSVDFVSATASQGSCNESGGVVTCAFGTLASGGNATVPIVVVPTATGTITNDVEVTSTEIDDNPDNNTDSEDTTVKELLCWGLVPTIVGTPGPETITGTDGPDIIHGLQGRDVIRGLGGDDIICVGKAMSSSGAAEMTGCWTRAATMPSTAKRAQTPATVAPGVPTPAPTARR